ncbi:MarR family transcriptional regulator [Labrenzia sp. OB1]|uniref:MarR family transcriptional regulator n=1 Tax=Labrenzia sp. OB1 TaxID=1561204 RepID=UPI0009EE6D77|nr:MarR family transcriptional regulator [Labrenzia sp. OB1]
MTQTTEQMSLLDAIGITAPEEQKTPKKDKPAKAGTSEKKPRKKTSAKSGARSAAKAKRTAGTETPPAVTDASTADLARPAADKPVPGPSEVANDPLPLDKYLCFALYSANHAMHGVYKDLLKEIGLTYPQFLAMTVLWETSNVPVGTITAKLQLDTNTLTPLLKRLEAMGLITRTRNIKDERQVILKLTRKGRALQRKTQHFSNCILSSAGLELEEVMELQSKIMLLRDNLRDAGVDT